jgi:phosphoribosyl-dephospho-CoA transferase
MGTNIDIHPLRKPSDAPVDWRRHTMVDVSDQGREAMLADLAGSDLDRDRLREKFGRVLLPGRAGGRIPGIVRREEGAVPPGCVPLGFSDPVFNGEGRLRIAAFARVEEIVGVMSPYEIPSLPAPRSTPCTRALATAEDHAHSLGLVLGVWGSVAMEMVTRLPFIRDGSDLDLIVAEAPRFRLSRFLTQVLALENRFGLRIDVEVDLANGFGVQLKELLGPGRTVLGKSFTGVALLSRGRILEELESSSDRDARVHGDS